MDIDKIIDKVNDLMALASDPAASDNEASLAYERARSASSTATASRTGGATARGAL